MYSLFRRGVYLTDLTFVEDGNPDKVLDMINFKKRILEYDIIVQVLKFQTHNYSFKLVRARGNALAADKNTDETVEYG